MKITLKKDFLLSIEDESPDNNGASAYAHLSRRGFLKASGGATACFSLASFISAGTASAAEAADSEHLELNAFVEVHPDGAIRIYAHVPEKGQGIKTSLPMIIAEELGADWNDVTVVRAPFNESVYGIQRAGGSTSTPREWNPMRQAGAAARVMFISAAAKRLNLSPTLFYTENSAVINRENGERISFAELAMDAAMEPIPDIESLVFKNREDYTLLGTRVSDVDNPIIMRGGSLFGSDLQLPGMLYAAYEKCPATYGTVASANLDYIKTLPGVVDAFVVQGNDNAGELLDGVAIVARSTWQAFQAKQQLEVEWDTSSASVDDNEGFFSEATSIANAAWPEADQVSVNGDVEEQFADENTEVVQSTYRFPYLAHACMEPMNCTARYDRETNSIEIWAPTRQPQLTVAAMENALGIPPENVTLHMIRMGGSFGRRRLQDYSSEAAAIAMRVNAPVKLQWTREDDLTHDQYRPGGVYGFKAAVSREGRVTAMQTHLVGPSIRGRAGAGVNLSEDEFPALNLDNYRGALSLINTNTPTGSWRAPGSNATGWAVQSFIAELAAAAGRDHVDLLIEMMGEPRWFEPGNQNSLNTGRAVDVIRMAAERSGWGKSLPAGRGLGLAFHFSHRGHVAEAVELSVDADKRITIHNVTVALDIGPIINMSGALKQVEGAATDALSSMYDLEITMQNGRIQQQNFHQYNILRMRNAPVNVQAHFIQSEYDPTGLGEPVLPPLMPAVTNAIFAATGERVRVLPLSKSGFTLA